MDAVIVVVPQKAPAPLAVTVAGSAFMVRLIEAIQPVGSVYVIPVTPPDTPVAMPVAEPIVAMPVLPLLHNPPTDVVARDVALPAQINAVPVMGAGNGLTTTGIVATHPVPNV